MRLHKLLDSIRFKLPLYVGNETQTIAKLVEIEKSACLTPTELESVIQKKKHDLLEHTFINVPWYRDIANSLPSIQELSYSLDSWREIPLTDRNVILQEEMLFVSDMNTKRKWRSTSGSTGRKFRFLDDPTQRICAGASIAYVRKLITGDLAPKELVIWGAPRDQVSARKYLSRLKSLLMQKRTCIAYNIDEALSASICNVIEAMKPDLITGYPNILLKIFSKTTLASDLTSEILCAGEWLRPDIRKRLEDFVGKRVYDFYGCREVGSIAFECERHNGLHILSPSVFVEVIDSDGHQCRPGEIGEIVVTSLLRRSMPLIRYRIGDMGTFSEESCPCGISFPLLKKLCGRTMDVIDLPNGKSFAGYFWTHFARDVEGIDHFRLVQGRDGFVEMQIVPSPDSSSDIATVVLQEIENQTNSGKYFRVSIVDDLPVNQSGKSGLIVSNYKRNV